MEEEEKQEKEEEDRGVISEVTGSSVSQTWWSLFMFVSVSDMMCAASLTAVVGLCVLPHHAVVMPRGGLG